MKKIFFIAIIILVSNLLFCQISKDKWNEKYKSEIISEPYFPGGDSAYFKYMSDNIIYPSSAINDNYEGTVLIQFTIDTIGNLHHLEINRSARGDIDTVALNIFRNMPLWSPAKVNGKKVESYLFVMPIIFKIK